MNGGLCVAISIRNDHPSLIDTRCRITVAMPNRRDWTTARQCAVKQNQITQNRTPIVKSYINCRSDARREDARREAASNLLSVAARGVYNATTLRTRRG